MDAVEKEIKQAYLMKILQEEIELVCRSYIGQPVNDVMKYSMEQELATAIGYYSSQSNIEITSVEDNKIKMNVTATPCPEYVMIDFPVHPNSNTKIVDDPTPDLVELGLY